MRNILLTSVLLGLPLAAAAQEEPQTTQTQYGQEQAQDTQTQQQQQQAGMQASAQTGAEPEIERAQFTSEVQNREPVDEVSDFQAQQEPLYFFTEVKNAAGETITHRWMHNGEVMAEVPLEIGSDSWRTWSSKEFVPGWDGEWTVEVVDAQGNTLEEASISVETRQMQNVGYSPDQQGQQQPQQNQGQTQDQQSPPQSQDMGQDSGMQTETIDYPPPQSGQQSGQQDQEMQSQDTQMQDDQSPVTYEPPTEDTESQDTQSDTQTQDDQQGVGEDY